MADKKLTNSQVMTDFADAHEYKRKSIEQQRNDHLFALGKQWDDAVLQKLRRKKVKAITDNRVRTNIFLLTGMERQNRSDFRAFPEGEEDSIDARVATSLFKNVMKRSGGAFKFSEMFEDGITGGESYLELYLDSTFNLLNPKPIWTKMNFDQIFPEPGWKEYDLSDCAYVNKYISGIKKGDLQALFPDKANKIDQLNEGLLNPSLVLKPTSFHVQERDYPKETKTDLFFEGQKPKTFDLLERYYKKWVMSTFVFDTAEGDLIESLPTDGKDKRDTEQIAKDFISKIEKGDPEQAGRFRIYKKQVPQIWRYAMTGGMDEPLEDKIAWFYPKWRSWPFIPYLAHWSNIPVPEQDRHLGIQGVVRGSKDSQEEHNKRKTQYLRHLDVSTNSGWLTQENSWVDRKKVEEFGSVPGVNLEYRIGAPKPERIFPMPVSQGHVFSSEESAQSIKAQTGINADLLSSSERADASGRAIALRQRQGIVMVQKLFDNLSRTKQIAGKFMLSQLNEIFTVTAVKKVLGEAFIRKNFSRTEQGPDGQPATVLDSKSEMELQRTINKVLNDVSIGKYDVAVGESVMSETMRMAQFNELKEFVQMFPQAVNPQVIIEESSLSPAVKSRLLQTPTQVPGGKPNAT